MANQLILQGLKRLWKYAIVPSGGDMMMDPEEDDPVGAFLDRQKAENNYIKTRRGKDVPSVVDPAAESAVPDDDANAISEGIPEQENVTGVPMDEGEDIQMPGKKDILADGSQAAELEGQSGPSSIGLVNELSQEAVGEVADKAPQPENQESEQTVPDETGQNAGEVVEGDMADMLDVFKSESIRRVPDAIQDSLTDIDPMSLIEIGNEILNKISNR